MLAKRDKISGIIRGVFPAGPPLHAVGYWLLQMTMTTEQANNTGALPALQVSISSLSTMSFLNKIFLPIR